MNTTISRDVYLEGLREMAWNGENYIVSWSDKDGNEWFGDFMILEEAAILFNETIEPFDIDQISCQIWSYIDKKYIAKYSNIENKYYF